jgi:hypothetical protein
VLEAGGGNGKAGSAARVAGADETRIRNRKDGKFVF